MPALRDFDVAAFLRDIWQQRPLLIRNAWREWSNPLEPNDLAGLACETEIESRLVLRPGPGNWDLKHGPFVPDRFAKLGTCPWTLLVQAVDHHVPDVAALIEPFRFIPNWRIDDVMVSYASDGGGVGPHFDQYDVFLVQGLGQRRWRIGQRCDDSSELLPHDGLRLLAEFETHEEWVLDPGDILYVPPGFAHDGVAVGDDCMTYSVGFRAPSRGDLVSAWTDHVLDTLAEDDRYSDAGLTADANPGEISPDAIARLHDMVIGGLADRAGFASWFGRYVTEPKNELLDWSPEEQVTAAELKAGGSPCRFDRNPASRFSFVRHEDDAVELFVNGASYTCRGPVAQIAERLCAEPSIELETFELALPDVSDLIVDLVNRGCIALSEPD